MAPLNIKNKTLPAVLLIVALLVLFGTALPGRPGGYFWPLFGLALGLGALLLNVILSNRTDEQQRLEEEQHLRQFICRTDKLKTIDGLAASLAHDWNNVLLPLSMEASRLRDSPESNDTILECAETLELVVSDGRRTTDRLVGFIQRDTEASGWIALQSTVRDAVEGLRRLLPRHIAMQIDYAANDDIGVMTTVPRLHQLVQVLGLTAGDGIGDRKGVLTISISGPTDGEISGRRCPIATLVVGDNGQGMSQKAIDQVFDPLFIGTRDDNRGTGLFVARSLVTQMLGDMTIDSTVAGGTSVTVTLPARKSPD